MPGGHGASASATPAGYGPLDLQSAYKLNGSSSGGRTVAIVDAYDDPTAEADLATYRSQYGLPPCGSADGCFRKVNQNGVQGSYPRVNGGWAQEISLDLDMVSATCPDCKILLVEASSSSLANLGTAVKTAAQQAGVIAISNSYGGGDAPDSTYGRYYDHPNIAITASSGDSGYGAAYPADSRYVTAVGGTSLRRDTSTGRGWSETAWSGAGSGCSRYNSRVLDTAPQNSLCNNLRGEADVSAVADPNTGVAVYDSTSYQGRKGWLVFGGTSVASPVVASIYALAGDASGTAHPNTLPYGHTSALNDVTSGRNGSCGSALCISGPGWDGPTGLGTPNGTGAF
jgi:subtilase family serine protease